MQIEKKARGSPADVVNVQLWEWNTVHLWDTDEAMIHLSKIPGTSHQVLGSMSRELTDNPPGIWGYVG